MLELLPPAPPVGKLFRRAKDLTVQELLEIVEELHVAFYYNPDGDEAFWCPEREVNGGDLVEKLGELFGDRGMSPPGDLNNYRFEFSWKLPTYTHTIVFDSEGVDEQSAVQLASKGVFALYDSFPDGKVPAPRLTHVNGVSIEHIGK